jgi:acetyl esterase/lipase
MNLRRLAVSCLVTLNCLTAATVTAEESVQIEKGIAYLNSDRAERADLYLPPSSKPGELRPAVVIIHGGGWTGGRRDANREINIGTTLASHGYVCLSIDYALQSEDPAAPKIWPQNLHDCKTAVRWLRASADKYQIDTSHIGVIGGSAGGHLAAMVGLTGPELDPPGPHAQHSTRVQAVIDLYGPMAHNRTRIDRLVDPANPQAAALAKQITPLSHIDSSDPPVLILHGTADKTVDVADSELFAAALETGGVAHELVIIEGAPHTFHLQPKQRDLRPVVLAFLDKYLKPKQGG